MKTIQENVQFRLHFKKSKIQNIGRSKVNPPFSPYKGWNEVYSYIISYRFRLSTRSEVHSISFFAYRV